MEKKCDKCNVIISEYEVYCPLCGRCCDVQKVDTVGKNDDFPIIQPKDIGKKFCLKLIFGILVCANLLSFLTELFIFGYWTFTVYLFATSVYIGLAFLHPFNRNWTVSGFLTWSFYLFSAYILFLEFQTWSYGWGMVYVVPCCIALLNAVIVSLMIAKVSNRWEYMSTILGVTILSIILLLVNYFTHFTLWPSLVAFFSSITIILILFIFKYKKTKGELQKNFHV